MHLYNLNLLIKKMFSSWWLHGNKLEVSCILMQDTKVCRMRIWAPLSATTPDVFFYWNCCKKWLQCPSENERIHLAIKRTHFLTDIAVILHNDFKEKNTSELVTEWGAQILILQTLNCHTCGQKQICGHLLSTQANQQG